MSEQTAPEAVKSPVKPLRGRRFPPGWNALLIDAFRQMYALMKPADPEDHSDV